MKILLVLLCLPAISDAQVQQWVARYNNSGNSIDVAIKVAVDDSGNVYVTGGSQGSGTDFDYATVKYNSSGVQLWVARYNGPANGDDRASALAIDDSDNVYVTGYSTGTSWDYATIKYNSSGIQIWVARYDGPASSSGDAATAIVLDDSGNIYVTGFSDGDYATIKYNSSGQQVWVARYNDPLGGYDYPHAMTKDILGNIYITGISSEGYATVKYSPAGAQQWVAIYDGPGNTADRAFSVCVDFSGNVFVTGESEGIGTGISDIATVKYDSMGSEIWSARYNGTLNGRDVAYSVQTDGLGFAYVTGQINDVGFTSSDYVTIKYGDFGIQQWAVTYNGPANDYDLATSLVLDESRNVYITGYSRGNGTVSDYATIKYDSSGIQQWLARFNGPANGGDQAWSICIDQSGNIYVTGNSSAPGSGIDYGTVKYSQPLPGIEQQGNGIPESFKLHDNYPNPFNSTTRIKFDIPRFGGFSSGLVSVRLVILDILGREVEEVVNEILKPGSYQVEWDAANYASGVYYYMLTRISGSERFFQTKKMILIK